MYLLMMHVRILKKKTTSCSKYAPTAHIAVPTDVRTSSPYVLTIAISTHLLHKTAVFLRYVPTAVTTADECAVRT